MAFIGAKPTNVPLTSSDLEDGIITNSKLAQDIISAETELATAPADTDEFLISDAGVLKRLDASLIGGGGITVAGQWRITTSFTGSVNPLANNWEENDTNYSRIGSAMSQSSGVFTFPETGVYMIEFQRVASLNGDDRFTTNYIAATTDNSSYTNIAYGDAHIKQAGGSTGTLIIASTFFDVTNTSTHKIRFQVANVNGSTQTVGSSTQNITFATFIRLGDT